MARVYENNTPCMCFTKINKLKLQTIGGYESNCFERHASVCFIHIFAIRCLMDTFLSSHRQCVEYSEANGDKVFLFFVFFCFLFFVGFLGLESFWCFLVELKPLLIDFGEVSGKIHFRN